MPEKSLWQLQVERNPGHSQWYIDRFKNMAAQGADLVGEARLAHAVLPPKASILDAGCGPGRLGSYLSQQGHRVVGVDIDPLLIAEAQKVCPQAQWITADLAELPQALQQAEAPHSYDGILCAGNVMTFLAPSTRQTVLSNFKQVLREQGRALVGFGAGRGYSFDQFFTDVHRAGLSLEHTFSSWDLAPYQPESSFLLAFLKAETS